MKTIAVIVASLCLAVTAEAAESCKNPNLHGAALTSFVKKCCKDQAATQKLHGAAETSFVKKCVSDSGT
jgi:hypothetical protein